MCILAVRARLYECVLRWTKINCICASPEEVSGCRRRRRRSSCTNERATSKRGRAEAFSPGLPSELQTPDRKPRLMFTSARITLFHVGGYLCPRREIISLARLTLERRIADTKCLSEATRSAGNARPSVCETERGATGRDAIPHTRKDMDTHESALAHRARRPIAGWGSVHAD